MIAYIFVSHPAYSNDFATDLRLSNHNAPVLYGADETPMATRPRISKIPAELGK